MADVSSTKSLMESCFRRRSRKSSLSITSTRRLMASYGLHHSRTFASGTNLISQFTASRGRHRSKCFTLGIALRPAHPTVFHGRTPLSWPNSLVRLEFGIYFDRGIKGVTWPSSLHVLYFEDNFNEAIDE